MKYCCDPSVTLGSNNDNNKNMALSSCLGYWEQVGTVIPQPLPGVSTPSGRPPARAVHHQLARPAVDNQTALSQLTRGSP